MTTQPSAPPAEDEQRRVYSFKILVIGDIATGKTAIVKRYARNHFDGCYRTTIGVDFLLKIIQLDDGSIIRVQLWDIGGQERFAGMMRAYYKEAVGCIVVYDVTRALTFDVVSKWKTDLDEKVRLSDGSRLPSILLANKCDLPRESWITNPRQMEDYCQENGFDKWFETSAKENINIDVAMQFLLDEIMKNTIVSSPLRSENENGTIDLNDESHPKDDTSCSC